MHQFQFLYLTLCVFLAQGQKLPPLPSSKLTSSALPTPALPSKPSSSPPPPPPPTPTSSSATLPASKLTSEDQETINKTIAKYGYPRDYKILNLPGPELSVDDKKLEHTNKLVSNGSEVYTLRIRTVLNFFSYNGRYEESKLKKISGRQIPVIKGQFGEHFGRKSGGYYVRTIGYILDENGYQQFLMDLTKADTGIQRPTVLATLIGGNSLG